MVVDNKELAYRCFQNLKLVLLPWPHRTPDMIAPASSEKALQKQATYLQERLAFVKVDGERLEVSIKLLNVAPCDPCVFPIGPA